MGADRVMGDEREMGTDRVMGAERAMPAQTNILETIAAANRERVARRPRASRDGQVRLPV